MAMRNNERGNQTVEFTLIGLPLTFLLFSLANMCFAMMTLHTMQESVEQTARIVATRGSTCSQGTNSCQLTVQQIADFMASNAAGINSANLKVTFQPTTGSSNTVDSTNTVTCTTLSSCQSSCSGTSCTSGRSGYFPPSTNGDNAPGQDIIVSADITIPTVMFMFWTGASSTSNNISSTTFHAYSRQRLMF